MSEEPHSAGYLGEQRDFLWNADFLELMAKRLKFDEVKSVLDVGCGIGHWGQILSTVLPEDSNIIGVDREPEWVKQAQERVKPLKHRFHYQEGSAQHLPFADDQFDMVTCQTVLMHVPDVMEVLNEMKRVLKPGGLLLVAEPDNFASRACFDSLSIDSSVVEIMRTLEFYLTCEKGKQNLGLGFNSIGGIIPLYFQKINIKNIKVYLSDKVTPIIPPYSTKEEQVVLAQAQEWHQQGFLGPWNREKTKKYYLSGGGSLGKFEEQAAEQSADRKKFFQAIQDKKYSSAGGRVMFLVSGRKEVKE